MCKNLKILRFSFVRTYFYFVYNLVWQYRRALSTDIQTSWVYYKLSSIEMWVGVCLPDCLFSFSIRKQGRLCLSVNTSEGNIVHSPFGLHSTARYLIHFFSGRASVFSRPDFQDRPVVRFVGFAIAIRAVRFADDGCPQRFPTGPDPTHLKQYRIPNRATYFPYDSKWRSTVTAAVKKTIACGRTWSPP